VALSTRLFVAFAVLALVIVLIMAWVTQTLVAGLFVDYLSVTRPWQASVLSAIVTEAYDAGGWAAVQQTLDRMAYPNWGGVSQRPHGHHGRAGSGPGGMMGLPGNLSGMPPLAVTDPDGIVRASTADIQPGTPIDASLLDVAYPLERDTGVFGFLVFNPDQLADLNPLVRFISPVLGAGVAQVDSPEEAYRVAVSRATWFTAVLAVGLAGFMGWWVSRRLAKTLDALAVGADRFARGDLAYTIEVGHGDAPEVKRVAGALNSMAGRIARARHRERELFADIAHELRTPLTIMRGQLDSLQESTAESPERVILSMQDEILRLSRLVSDLGQLSLADIGKLPLKKEDVKVRDLLAPVVEGFSAEAQARGIALEWVSDSTGGRELEWVLHVDPIRIQQVLANLIGNAMRHTPQGGTVRVEHRFLHGQLEVTVRDNGEGISPEALTHIFDRFYRADSSRARETGGTGLGLAIARGYVEAHGGSIHADSTLGEGTTIRFCLPID